MGWFGCVDCFLLLFGKVKRPKRKVAQSKACSKQTNNNNKSMSWLVQVVLMVAGWWAGVVRFVTSRFPRIGRLYDVVATTILCSMRLLAGNMSAFSGPKQESDIPPKPLVLYEFEGCPFCRRVREAISALALDVLVYPCPRETLTQYGYCKDSRFRPEVLAKGGKLQFPFLIDPNQGNKQLYESDPIIKCLWATYGKHAKMPLNYRLANTPWLRPLELLGTLFVGAFLRLPEQGTLRIPSRRPDRPLELWGHQGSPFVMLVRERLCSLEIPYIHHNMPIGDIARRRAFKARYGNGINPWRRAARLLKIPFLYDPNTNTEMFESADIVNYLDAQYRTGAVPTETLASYSTRGAGTSHGPLGSTKPSTKLT